MVCSESQLSRCKDIDVNSIGSDSENISYVYVDDDAESSWYDSSHVRTIQEGIENVSHYNTVFVHSGTYNENVIVYKRINLIGENKENTVVDGGEKGNVISVIINEVTIRGFTISNSNKEFLDIQDNSGIYVNSNYCNISENLIKNNLNGISISGGEHNRIYSNTFTNNKYRKIILLGSGIQLSKAKNNVIMNNSFFENSDGIDVSSSQGNVIENNTFNKCKTGVRIYQNYNSSKKESTGNIVRKNSFISNKYGVYISESKLNKIILNSFRKNIDGVHISESTDNNIQNNNFILNVISASFDADKIVHIFNNWDENYWNRPRIGPKIIFGSTTIFIPRTGVFPIPLINLDRNPAKNPFDI